MPHIYLYPDPVKSSKFSRVHNTLPNKEDAVKPSPYLVNPQQVLQRIFFNMLYIFLCKQSEAK